MRAEGVVLEMPSSRRSIDWNRWLRRWDRQQTGYMPYREERFATMLDIVEAMLAPNARVIDLACGPGSLSERLLARLPKARSIAVDFDPVLLELGRHALHRWRHRLTWVEADLRDATWPERLPSDRVDAVLTTTALHWLTAPELTRVYRQLHALLPEGGVLMNGDHMAFEPSLPQFRALAKSINRRRTEEGFRERGAEKWDTWWGALEKEPLLAPFFAERHRRFPHAHGRDQEYLAHFHEAALKDAGFREVGTAWQNLDNRVLLAIA